MTAPEFRLALAELHMTQREFARRAGLLASSVNRYAQGDRPVPGWVDWVVELLRQSGGT